MTLSIRLQNTPVYPAATRSTSNQTSRGKPILVTSAKRLPLLDGQAGVQGSPLPPDLDGVDDLGEHVAQDPDGVGLDGEQVGQAQGRAVDEGHRAVPDVDGVLDAADGLVGAAAAAVHVAVGPVLAVHLRRQLPGVPGHRRAGPVADQRGVLAGEHHRAPEVRLDEVAAAGHGEVDGAAHHPAEDHRRRVLEARDRHQGLEEPPLVVLRRREVHRELGVGPLEAAVHVAVADRVVPPLVDVQDGRPELRVLGTDRPCAHVLLPPITVDGPDT